MSRDEKGPWPEGVRPISIEELDRLGLNLDNELFWDGRRIEVRRTLVLTFGQKVVALLAILASLATIATGTQNGSLFLCSRGVQWACPVQVPASSLSGEPAPAVRP